MTYGAILVNSISLGEHAIIEDNDNISISHGGVTKKLVTIDSSQTAGLLSYNSDTNSFETVSSSAGGLTAFNDITDVTLTNETIGNFIKYDGTNFVNSNLLESDVPTLPKDRVGLGNVDDTSDENKPISIATAAALADKAPLANPTFTGTVSGIDKNMVGLGNVDNTSDENKPISNATAAALADKAPLANPTFTGTVSGIDTNMITGLEDALNGKQDTITLTTDLSIQKLSVNKGIEWADSEISYLTCVTFSGTTMTVDAKGKGYVPLYVQQNSGSTYSTINLTDMENGAQVIVALYGSGIISSTLEIQVEVEGVFVPKTLKKNFTSDLTWTNTTHVLLAFFKMGDCIYLTGQELS